MHLQILSEGTEIFNGTVAELQFTVNEESVSVAGRFKPAPTPMEQLELAARARELLTQNGSDQAPIQAPNLAAVPNDDDN